MPHNQDGTEIVTADDARRYMREHDCDDLLTVIAWVRNVFDVDIDDDGDVYVGSPQPHWLSDDELLELARRVAS